MSEREQPPVADEQDAHEQPERDHPDADEHNRRIIGEHGPEMSVPPSESTMRNVSNRRRVIE